MTGHIITKTIKDGTIEFRGSDESGVLTARDSSTILYDIYIKTSAVKAIKMFVETLEESANMKDVVKHLHSLMPQGINDSGRQMLGIFKQGLVNNW